MTQIKIFTATTNEDSKVKWSTDRIHTLQRKVNNFLALYDGEIEVKDIKYSTQCMYEQGYIKDDEKIWTVMIIYETKDIKSVITNENAKKARKDFLDYLLDYLLKKAPRQPLVFRSNPEYVQTGMIPYISGNDLFDKKKYNIRVISTFDYDKNGFPEDGEIIATYNSLEELVDAGWMLEID